MNLFNILFQNENNFKSVVVGRIRIRQTKDHRFRLDPHPC